jgi:hypothetical protein
MSLCRDVGMLSVETSVQLDAAITSIWLGVSLVERKRRLSFSFFDTGARPLAVKLRERVSRVFAILRSLLPWHYSLLTIRLR